MLVHHFSACMGTDAPSLLYRKLASRAARSGSAATWQMTPDTSSAGCSSSALMALRPSLPENPKGKALYGAELKTF